MFSEERKRVGPNADGILAVGTAELCIKMARQELDIRDHHAAESLST